jgi:transcriptional regulator
MYLPKHFEQNDPAALHALLRAHPFATWVVAAAGDLLVNHVPFLLDAERGAHGTLVGHVARANPVWRAVAAGAASVAIFHGPQAYVSPAWYPSKRAHGKVVPTWNYAVVHAHGTPRIVDDLAAKRAIVERLTDTQEAALPQRWRVDDAPADFVEAMLGAIVGIEIDVERWVGKWKISQNRSADERSGVVDGLRALADPQADAMAALVAGIGE